MDILILGGTGSMGISLVDILSKGNVNVTVTSRSHHESNKSNVLYIQGNAKDDAFLHTLLNKRWDCIVDFMSYTTKELESRIDLLLNSTDQYIFLSSCRVYAPSNEVLTEDSPRLLDVCKDEEYLKTDEYALAKAKEENIILSKNNKNYTIVRPGITYNKNRLQLGISEKEEWLYRIMHNRTLVLPEDIKEIKTTMTCAQDVALAMSKLIGNEKAYGEVIQIVSEEYLTWQQVYNVYNEALASVGGGNKIKIYSDIDALDAGTKLNRYYQIKYARGIDRRFNSNKLRSIIGDFEFTPPEAGLKHCLNEFLDKPSFLGINARSHAYFDKLTKEKTRLSEFTSLKRKIGYLVAKYFLF